MSTRIDRSCICDPMVTRSDELPVTDLNVLHMTTIDGDDDEGATIELYFDHDATWL